LYIQCFHAVYLERGKAELNLQQHGFDFVDAETVFEGPTYTYEDDRFN
jgi:uncharacterized protein